MNGRTWAVALALLVALTTAPPISAEEAERPGRVVNTEGAALRLRAAPDAQAPILKRLGPDWRLMVGDPSPDGKWLRVEHGGTRGYVATGYVALEDASPSTPTAPRAGQVSNTAGANLRLRASASLDAPIIKRLGPAWSVTVLGAATIDGRWLRVEHGGTIGYAMADYIALSGPSSQSTPSTPARSGWVANTDGTNLRVRTEPSVSGAILKRLAPGARVSILEGPFTSADGASWVKISHGGVTGYAAATYIAGSAQGGGDPGLAPAPVAGRVMALEIARLRTQPSVSAPIITRLLAGTTVEATGRAVTADGYHWRQVRFLGREGWVAAFALGAAPGQGAGDRLAAEALTHVGRPYVWGGETPAVGFDCSGLVRYVFKTVLGTDVTHVLEIQAETGRAVERDALEVGDLVFFQDTYKPGLSHVGFYLGNGRFVSAQNERTGIAIASLDTPYWRDRYHSARRLTP